MTKIVERWPELPYAAWKDTRDTLHLWTQIVGKIRLAFMPWVNHAWHVTLNVTVRGLTTTPILHPGGEFAIAFDFIDHALRVQTSDGRLREFSLAPMPVAQFYAGVIVMLKDLGIEARINTIPNEIPGGIAFEKDTEHKSYDPEYANRFWRVLLSTYGVMYRFRSGFLGKVSPAHFFWGSFDLAITRFSGRSAPAHPGGVPRLPNSVAQEAYSHEVSSAGFWPGGGGPVEYPAFYSYAYPAPEGFADAAVRPEGAFFSKELGEFLFPYEEMRKAADPDAALLEFFQSTYEAAADLGKWDRKALECPFGVPGKVRTV